MRTAALFACACACALVFALVPAAAADEIQDAVTKLVESRSDPFVIVEFDLKRADGTGGRSVTLQAMVVSDDGLVLVTGAKLVDPPVGSSETKPTEFQVKFPGDKKRKATFFGKDEELNLALLKMQPPEEKEGEEKEAKEKEAEEKEGEEEKVGDEEKPLVIKPATFAPDTQIVPGEQLIALKRLSKVDDDLMTFGIFRVTTVIPRPGQPPEYRVTGSLRSYESCGVWAFDAENNVRLVGFIASSTQGSRGRSFVFVNGRVERVSAGSGPRGHPTRLLHANTVGEFLADPSTFARRDSWLGAKGLQALTKDLAEALGVEKPGGLVVGRVLERSPAEKAGLKAEDVILALDDKVIDTEKDRDIDSFYKSMRRAKAGDTKKLTVLRKEGDDFGEVALMVTLEESPLTENEVSEYHDKKFGLKLKPLTRDFLEREHLSLDAKGVRVTSVESASWASLAGIRRGDVIRKMVLKPCDDLDQYKQIMTDLNKTRDSEVCYNVTRRRKSLFLCVRPDWATVEK